MQKAIVIGCPGAGKSVFARKLRDRTGLPLYYLDMIWHRPDRTNISAEEFDGALAAILRQERWIIDGNYLRTLEQRLSACDCVFLLDIPLEQCIAGAQSRIGMQREDLPWVEDTLDEEFRRWIVNFPQGQMPQIRQALRRWGSGREVVVFHSRQEADNYINSLKIHSDKS